ncbi:hypothetical protein [Tenacibaculum sp. M341]|uniref:hypothetical protein n=1 Tax=Tenacibaculum sp. M341 TaxID=2530339 RepID=UPI00104AEE3D|nr:hypothetical protein [Tenacibaculum sp. M341]TCI92779.1 hypothetical protein EYW44_07735 [Tenacibaculum sp. M341]
MTNKELQILLNDEIDKEKFIYKTYEDEDNIYVFTKLKKFKDIDYDDRYSTVGGNSPIMVNKKSEKFKRVHNLEVPTKLLKDNYKRPTLKSITVGIEKRKYVNFNDVFNFLEINFIKEDETRFTLADVLYEYDYDKENFKFHFKKDQIQNNLIQFLETVNVKSCIDKKGYLIINRIPKNS